jgi:hypothetical protein
MEEKKENGDVRRQQLLKQPTSINPTLLHPKLIHKHNLHALLQLHPEAVQMRISVLSEVVTPNDGTVSSSRSETVRVETEFGEVGGDELAEDGDAG